MATVRITKVGTSMRSPLSLSKNTSANIGSAKKMEPNRSVAWWAAAAAANSTAAFKNERLLPNRSHSYM